MPSNNPSDMPAVLRLLICAPLCSLFGAQNLSLAQGLHTPPYSIEILKLDPAKLCPISNKRIPKTFSALKKLAPVKAVNKLSCNYFMPDELIDCKAEEILYSGMKIVAIAFPNYLWVADLEISDVKHNYLGSSLSIGSPISTVENAYGIRIDNSKSPVVLQGECVPLSIWHTNGRITKVKLTCSAC